MKDKGLKCDCASQQWTWCDTCAPSKWEAYREAHKAAMVTFKSQPKSFVQTKVMCPCFSGRACDDCKVYSPAEIDARAFYELHRYAVNLFLPSLMRAGEEE